MLFNSFTFLFLFLPFSIVVYFFVGSFRADWARFGLALLSFAFYAYWDYRYLPLLIGSILTNYYLGLHISFCLLKYRQYAAKIWLVLGLIFNLLLLTFFKYGNLFISSLQQLAGTDVAFSNILLPIGISFFTFTQIAFLVDAHSGRVKECRFWDYALFVSYFPHQIAGPILHHAEMMSQFRNQIAIRFNSNQLAVGMSILTLGLAKKILVADYIADLANPIFNLAEHGTEFTFIEAWGGSLAYTLQLYFDFSAYCDMAVGISYIFGIRLPINFNSPYKAISIVDFWRRWHMTLSRFLRDYLYFPLGGNKRGNLRRYINLMITMMLGGFWHGASWTFLVWGGLHGCYLVINHIWSAIAAGFVVKYSEHLIYRGFCWVLTFGVVLIAWVFFRAESFRGAFNMLAVMSGIHGIAIPPSLYRIISFHGIFIEDTSWLGLMSLKELLVLNLALIWVTYMPNTQEVFVLEKPVLDDIARSSSWSGKLIWTPSYATAFILALTFGVALSRLGNDTQFLYFNF